MTDEDAIRLLGGTSAVAKLFGIQPSAVSNWLKDGIPDGRRYRIGKELQARGHEVPEPFFERIAPLPSKGAA